MKISKRRSALAAAVLVAMAASPFAVAQDTDTSTTASTGAVDAAQTGTEAAENPFARFDAIGLKGWMTPFPSTGDTILGDAGGLRSALADNGFGFLGLSVNNIMYDVANDGVRGTQAYNGEKATYNVGIQSLFAQYDLGRLGLEGAQLFGAATLLTHRAEHLNGPRDFRLTSLGYYQSFADGAVELKVGYFDNLQEYAGMSVGGSITSGSLGPQSRIPVQVGWGAAGFGTPALNMTFNSKQDTYLKVGVQRSMSPNGFEAELDVNGDGLRFDVPDASALYTGEWGYKRDPSAQAKSTWFRIGGIYNTSDYTRFIDGSKVDNWAAYAAIDHQFTQPNADMPFQGVYGGLTVNRAPDEQNFFTHYYEARIYGIGLLPNRPFDLVSVVASYNGLSKEALGASFAPGTYDSEMMSLVGSYAYRARAGVYIQPGVGVSVNPSFAPKRDTAYHLYLAATLLF